MNSLFDTSSYHRECIEPILEPCLTQLTYSLLLPRRIAATHFAVACLPQRFPIFHLLADYIRVIVKLPDPVQSTLPVNDQCPVIVAPFTVPVRVNTLPLGFPDVTVIPKVPCTFPLKFPVRPKVPVAVSPETKQEEFVEKERLVTFTVPLPVSTIWTVKLKA
jgi:hypothetical protein